MKLVLSASLIFVLTMRVDAGACPSAYDVSFQLAARIFALDWLELKAQACTENSTLDPVVRSHAGAVGCGQFLPTTWNWLREKWSLDWDIEDCNESLWMLVLYFQYHYEYFLNEGLSEKDAQEFAWAAYNRGKAGVLRTAAKLGKGLVWSAVRSHLPTETRNYGRKIRNLTRILRGKR